MLIISIESGGDAKFTLIKNIIHTNLTKCKKVTYVMLALKLYIIIIGINILIALSSIINIIINKFEIKQLLIVVYIDFFFAL